MRSATRGRRRSSPVNHALAARAPPGRLLRRGGARRGGGGGRSHGAIVLCDLHAADAEEAAAETAKAAAKAVAVAAAGGGAKGALLVDVFDSMDVDGSGTVDIAEYRSAVGNETMKAFFAYIDAQGVADGFLTREEWAKGMGLLGANMSTAQYESELRAMLAAGAGAAEARLATIFKAMDTDLDGKVSLAEYRSAVAGETMRAFFEYIDAQGGADGELTLGEWLAGMGQLGAAMSDAEFRVAELRRPPGEGGDEQPPEGDAHRDLRRDGH